MRAWPNVTTILLPAHLRSRREVSQRSHRPEYFCAYLSQLIIMEYYWTIFLFAASFGRTHGDCGAPPRLQFGELDTQFSDQDNFSTGAAVTYKCRSGFTRVQGTNNSITCLSNSTWSTPDEFCTRRSCGNPGDLLHGSVSFADTLFGSKATYTCDLGYNMISRRNFRECQIDGIWSNEVPVCEVQTCPPPNAITDGLFSPDNEEYEYLNAVTYQCKDKTYALIGEKTLSCTEHGNWSADPPQCKAVECSDPRVNNAEKVSGFSGPYHLHNAIEFRCLPGYTMVGSASVKCNVSSEWEPALPTCSRGNNTGAVVGNALIIFIMSVMAFVMNNGF